MNCDGRENLLGTWTGQGGVWVKYSSDFSWQKLSSTADWIACGKMRGAGTTSAMAGVNALSKLNEPVGGIAGLPYISDPAFDTAAKSPGGSRFTFTEQPNLSPLLKQNAKFSRVLENPASNASSSRISCREQIKKEN